MRRLVVQALSLFVIAVIAIAVAVVVTAGPQELAAIIPTRCTVGLAGAAVSVTYDGHGAQQQCDRWRGSTTDGGSWYQYQGGAEPAGAVICQMSVAGPATATVRDQGALNLYGTAVCKTLAAG